MAELIGYVTINGGKAVNNKFHAEVETQADIEKIRDEITKEVNKDNKPDEWGEIHHKRVSFAIRQRQGEGLKC